MKDWFPEFIIFSSLPLCEYRRIKAMLITIKMLLRIYFISRIITYEDSEEEIGKGGFNLPMGIELLAKRITI